MNSTHRYYGIGHRIRPAATLAASDKRRECLSSQRLTDMEALYGIAAFSYGELKLFERLDAFNSDRHTEAAAHRYHSSYNRSTFGIIRHLANK